MKKILLSPLYVIALPLWGVGLVFDSMAQAFYWACEKMADLYFDSIH